MMNYDQNPFPESDSERYVLWEMLVHSDIDAFLTQDWSKVADDFTGGHFMGIHGNKSNNPDDWGLVYHRLEIYKKDWLKQAIDFAACEYRENPRKALFNAVQLEKIEIGGDAAILHKKFDGSIILKDGTVEKINWQTIYQCKKENNRWKIIGFIGYLPN